MKRILIVVGTRPNFIKVTRFRELIGSYEKFDLKIIHTNQHYDQKMSEVFFEQFDIEIDHFLPKYEGTTVGHVSHIMVELESYFKMYSPDVVLAVGDVNSTFAAAFVANRLGIKVGHIESGLRSNDMDMPEEVNRILTDRITDMYFVTEQSGLDNLRSENVPADRIHFVGNTMIDTLVHFKPKIEASDVLGRLGISENESYSLLTIHRPSNVDSKEGVERLLQLLKQISQEIRIVFPMHHRTLDSLKRHHLRHELETLNRCTICESLDYFSFQKLIANAEIIITDSGGIQEETTFLQIPCLTLRENTERPSTIEIGTNQLMEFDATKILEIIKNKSFKQGEVPELWDGNATARILKVLEREL